ncbi:MAG TPA: PspC domain-containing protein [Candidatus Binatia bacterium]|jgi:phage shock protein PspC (stress-responsive transcriptional regulator)
MDEFRDCPFCGEQIRTAATRCRYCRSRLTTLDPERWYRDHPERRLAGVAAALARALVVPIGAVRLGFVVFSFVHLIGLLIYGALWLLIPFAPGGDAPLGRVFAFGRELLTLLRDAIDRLTAHRGEPPHRRGDDHDAGDEPPRTRAARPTTLPLQRASS